ncbi:hypothetical protein ACWEQP_26420 [Streptomyces sp. NPDC004044]
MEQVTFGRSGLRVSRAVLGTMTFGEQGGVGAPIEECRRILDTYLDAGGTTAVREVRLCALAAPAGEYSSRPRERRRAITGAHLVALVRSGSRFENGILVGRVEVAA